MPFDKLQLVCIAGYYQNISFKIVANTTARATKEAFRKMRYKKNMWRVYKHTGKDKDYKVYKEALNAATNELRKAKRNFEHKLAQHIKSDSKSFYAYVRSKQNVRDKGWDHWRTMLEI